VRDAHDGRDYAGAAPATVSGEHSIDQSTDADGIGKADRMLRPASQETCLKRKRPRAGCPEGRVCVRDDLACVASPIVRMSHFGVKSYEFEFPFMSARMTGVFLRSAID
jgi:hypothetical protein